MALSKTLFLTVALIHDIVHPEGKIPSRATMAAKYGVIERIKRGLVRARDAHDLDYRLAVPSDCCAIVNLESHRQTLAGRMSHVAEIQTPDELMAS